MEGVTLALCGAGSRGAESYAPHVGESPYKVRFTAVAEPRKEWRERAIRTLNIPRENAFESWEELAAQPQLADGILVTTQDELHTAPALAFMRKGYHILLEKPMATTEDDCREIIRCWRETGRMLTVCHVMRYSRYAQKMRELIAAGAIGEPLFLHHMEPIGYWHFAHSYVRGNWRREEDASPMLLAKSCHDLDIIRYWLDRRCLRVSSCGGLTHFKPECTPPGAARRCLDCPAAVESACPYSAVKIYMRDFFGNDGWPNNILTLDTSATGIEKALREGPYGRCVYACDNDVADHQAVTMEFEGGVTANFTVAAFTNLKGRETWIGGTKGQLRSEDMQHITHLDFRSNTTRIIDASEEGDASKATGHAGDAGIILNFIQAIAENDPAKLCTTPDISLESHLIAFAAERARKAHTVEEIRIDQ